MNNEIKRAQCSPARKSLVSSINKHFKELEDIARDQYLDMSSGTIKEEDDALSGLNVMEMDLSWEAFGVDDVTSQPSQSAKPRPDQPASPASALLFQGASPGLLRQC